MPRQRGFYTYIYLVVLLIACGDVLASDKAKEKRWADQIVDALIIGDAVWLKSDGDKILGIYAEQTTDKPHGGVILLHGIGVHPDWPDVINPLRSELPDHGWSTLSIQMPILHNEAIAKDYEPLWKEVPGRIKAATAFLKQQGIENMAIIGHSLGSAMASSYLAESKDPGIRALVGIGMGEANASESMSNIASLEKLTLPILDMYGSQDLDNVLNSAKDRKAAANKAKNKNYSQVKVEGANHFFQDMNATLIKRVRSWLARHAAGKEIRKP